MIKLVGQEAKLGLTNDSTLKNLLKFIFLYTLTAYNEDPNLVLRREESKEREEKEKVKVLLKAELKQNLYGNPKMINVLGIIYQITNKLLEDSDRYKNFAVQEMNYLKENNSVRERSLLEDNIQ